MLKIYFNNKALFVTNEMNKEVEALKANPNNLFIDHFNKHKVSSIIEKMEDGAEGGGIINTPEMEVLNALKQHLTLVQAAGGLVLTPNQNVLLIFRRGKWDLPKGKLDDGEALDVCAIREVEEETGLTHIHLKEKLLITYHTYYEKDEHILKETHWYLMHVQNEQELIPQTDEDIEKCEWISFENLNTYMQNTHPSIIDVVNKAKEILYK
jgi:8-oxo-dGTP pyrophosphatase MutT (NUDIX family)